MKIHCKIDKYATCGSKPMDWQDAVAIISSMMQAENHYLCHDYLNLKWRPSKQMPPIMHTNSTDCVDETCRTLVCNWIFNVIETTKLNRNTAVVAMGYLDRYLCSRSSRAMIARSSRKHYQLAAMTCMYIAGKLLSVWVLLGSYALDPT